MDKFSSESTLAVQGFTPYAQIPRWILRAGGGLSHGSVRLYGVIMTYADNDTKTAFPGREKLAEDMGIKARSVSTYIKELEDFGALMVERRRNKRTGNFYANHYTLRFDEPQQGSPGAEYCTPPSAADCPITTPTELPTPTGVFTSDESDLTCTPDLRSGARSPGELAGWQRKNLRKALQEVGQKIQDGKPFHHDDTQESWWAFVGLMEEHFPDSYDDGLADLLENGKWTVGGKVAEAYQAGVELNKLIATAALS